MAVKCSLKHVRMNKLEASNILILPAEKEETKKKSEETTIDGKGKGIVLCFACPVTCQGLVPE